MRVCIAGVTGRVGRELAAAMGKTQDLAVAAAVSRSHAGQDAGQALGGPAVGVTIASTVEEALASGDIDVMVDYTAPHCAKDHALCAIAKGVGVVIGALGLTEQDFQKIDAYARSHSVGAIAAENFSLTAALMQHFALMAAQTMSDIEVIDSASSHCQEIPSAMARQIADRIGVKHEKLHSLRLPGRSLSCEVVFGSSGETLTLRHEISGSGQSVVAGTLLAIRYASKIIGLRRGLEHCLARA